MELWRNAQQNTKMAILRRRKKQLRFIMAKTKQACLFVSEMKHLV